MHGQYNHRATSQRSPARCSREKSAAGLRRSGKRRAPIGRRPRRPLLRAVRYRILSATGTISFEHDSDRGRISQVDARNEIRTGS